MFSTYRIVLENLFNKRKMKDFYTTKQNKTTRTTANKQIKRLRPRRTGGFVQMLDHSRNGLKTFIFLDWLQCYGCHSQIIFHGHVVISEMIPRADILYTYITAHVGALGWRSAAEGLSRFSLTSQCLNGGKTFLNFVPIMPLCATTYIDGTRTVSWIITDTTLNNLSDCPLISIRHPFFV